MEKENTKNNDCKIRTLKKAYKKKEMIFIKYLNLGPIMAAVAVKNMKALLIVTQNDTD